MAKAAKLDMTVDVVNNAEAGLQEVEKSVERTAQSMQKAGKKTNKDWSGVTDLFSTLLPRGMQRSIRGFKSSMRSVGRLSKSFKVLKAAWASVGIGLAILAVEALIENWDKLTDALGFTSAANREAAEEYKEIAGSLAAAKNEGTEYLQILLTSKEGTEAYNLALEKVIATYGNAIDKEADLNTQRHQAMTLAMAKIALDETLIEKQQKKRQMDEKDAKVLEMQAAARRDETTDFTLQMKLMAESIALREEINDLTVTELAQEATLSDLIDKNVDKERKRADDKKKAEADLKKLKAESDREAEANAKYLANLEKTLSEEIMLAKIEDEEERQLKVLELRLADDRKKLEEAGGNWEDLLLLAEMYEIDKAAIEKSFKAEKDAEDEADRQQALADEQALEDEMYMIRTDGRDRELTAEQLKYEEEIMMSFDAQAKEELRAQQEFDARMLKAGENQELIKMVEEEYENQLTAITAKGESDRAKIVADGQAKELALKKAGQKLLKDATRQLFGTLEQLAGENQKAAQAFAITGVLLAQAVSLANAIAGATSAAKDTGPGAPYALAAYIITMVSSVLGAFVGVKAILSEATDGAGGSVGGGGGGRPNVQALVPSGVARLDSPEGDSNQAFVVQSELEGANLQANNMYGQTSLNPG